MGCGRLCQGLRRRRQIRGARPFVRRLIPGGLFLLQQSLHTAPRLICSTGSGILDSVAAVVAGLSPLGSLPELTAQALRSIIQTAANKLFRCGLDFFF